MKKSGLQNFPFIFVLGHAGVRGDESADGLASLAPISSARAIDRTDILNDFLEKFV